MRATIPALAGVALLAAVAAPAHAQDRLTGAAVASGGVVYEQWRSSLSLGTASELSVPLAVVVPLGDRWTVDGYGAYVRGTLTAPRELGSGRTTLNGLTDVKLRAVGQLRGDALVLTLGVNVPTGATKLTADEQGVLAVLAAPALRFRAPAVGTGAGATVGLVTGHQARGWALAAGASFEARGKYAPAEALVAGVDAPELTPGNAVHLSLAADRVAGQSRTTFSVIGDVFTAGRVGDAAGSLAYRPGPAVTAAWQTQLGTRRAATTIYAVERYRSGYTVGGASAANSARNELEGGVQLAATRSPALTLRATVDGRLHSAAAGGAASIASGLGADAATITTAGIRAAGLTLGASYRLGRSAASLEPFVRAQAGRLDFRSATANATGVGAGLSLSARF